MLKQKWLRQRRWRQGEEEKTKALRSAHETEANDPTESKLSSFLPIEASNGECYSNYYEPTHAHFSLNVIRFSSQNSASLHCPFFSRVIPSWLPLLFSFLLLSLYSRLCRPISPVWHFNVGVIFILFRKWNES